MTETWSWGRLDEENRREQKTGRGEKEKFKSKVTRKVKKNHVVQLPDI